ncbi:8-oxo-dGTP diphosphatase [Geothermobacter ehrlichii]|uniref:8-oxo-dGTP diphosphatase n=1 Tax=Geothermobacter ehrlichii TaxID=213224 RepID=A0A5D3WN26_9BACT|nr:NUDIX hydrolase [Geothermobacter ehrlichii]TYO99971.1 8-oxo-dGTP diphosphatase [Geothermobacter ehrlichii]
MKKTAKHSSAPTITCPECGSVIARRRNPFPTVDVIIRKQNAVLLIERKNPPHGWALPGGFVDYGESVEQAAVREIREETGLEIDDLTLFGVYSDPDRDPRQHNLSVVFTATGEGDPVAGDDAGKARWFPLDRLPSPLCFDHDRILADYVRRLFGAGGSRLVPLL